MKLTLYHVDAFADKLFSGNPAAVVLLDKGINAELMQQIASENNLSDTAFFVPINESDGADFDIRWFTPVLEINLCGHATLAAAFIIFNYLHFNRPEIKFNSPSGILKVIKRDHLIEMDFPSWKPNDFSDISFNIADALGGVAIKSIFKSRDLLIELADEEAIINCVPDLSLIKKSGHKIIITATGKEVDFVSRFFAPTAGIDEDPVTGSAHSQLIPYWSNKLNKTKMIAKQLSKRGGTVYCEQNGDRVIMGGNCIFYMKGEIEIEN